MRTIKPKRPKAPWFRAIHGDGPATKPILRIRPVSKRQAPKLRAYNAKAKAWKEGRLCAGAGLTHEGRYICGAKEHLCAHVHHQAGKVGPLLMDERYWVPACETLHSFIHANPKAARKYGLIVDGPWNHTPRLTT